jgi:hypothetical protein
LRRRPAELLRVVERQALELHLLAGRAIEVEQHQPGLGMLRAGAARAGLRRQRLLALLEVGVGEGDHRLVEIGVVGDLGARRGERGAEVPAGVRSSLIGANRCRRRRRARRGGHALDDLADRLGGGNEVLDLAACGSGVGAFAAGRPAMSIGTGCVGAL